MSPRIILAHLSQQSASDVFTVVGSHTATYDSIVQHLNNLPYVYASQYPHLEQDSSVLGLGHPLLFQTFKPVNNPFCLRPPPSGVWWATAFLIGCGVMFTYKKHISCGWLLGNQIHTTMFINTSSIP